VQNNLEKLREERGLSRRTLAEKAASAYSTIYNFEKGIAGVSDDLLKRLAEVLAVRPEDILPLDAIARPVKRPGNHLSGPDMALRETFTGEVREFKVDYRTPRRVPVVGFVAGADFLGNRAFNYSDMASQIEDEIETTSKDPNALGLIVEGDSMYPEIKAGDRIVVAPNSEPRNDDVVVARLEEDGAAIIKRFRRSGPEGRTIHLESTNKHYADIVKDVTAFRFIYPVVKIERTRR
jgi:phage repressor protein C with HTH and peptisase S24 domain